MLKLFFRAIVARGRRQSRPKTAPLGLSLAEVLIGSSLAVVVISMLTFLMNSLLQNNQREQSRSGVEDDMRRAANYIANDLRKAVYIYTGDQLDNARQTADANTGLPQIDGLKTYLPSFGANVRPILAFWKVEALPYDGAGSFSLPTDCNAAFPPTPPATQSTLAAECTSLKVERRTYTLIVYTQSTDSTGGWKGESRIERYQLRKYSNLTTLTRNAGYVDPVNDSSFDDWPFTPAGLNPQAGTMDTSRQTLVDFVARPTVANSYSLSSTTPLIQCSREDANGDGVPDYIPSPADGTDSDYSPDNAFSFFTCVRSARGGARFNQDVLIVLTGNIKGKAGVDQDLFLEPIQSRAIGRGVVDKSVSD